MLIVRELCRPGLLPVSFQLDRAECVALQGPSGSGKSLLLRALADLDPTQGAVTLEGRPRATVAGPLWRRQVMYVPAESGWWSERVRDHFCDWTRAAPLLERLHLPAAAGDWPVQRLSTGERQRLALARALLLQPRVLLLDEPTAALDGESTAAVEQLVGEYRSTGGAALWVTHDPQQARRLSPRGFFMNGGRFREAPL
jgi:phosphate-transporting ATPase